MINKQTKFWGLYKHLYNPMDIAGMAFVRIYFGIIIITEAIRYTSLMRIVAKYTRQDFYFKFHYFEWVQPIPAEWMQVVFIVYAISGLLISLGLFYRFAVLVASLCISYIFLVDAANYLNHFYLVIVFSFMMLFIPAHKGWSIYAWLNPKKASGTIPGWTFFFLRAELTIVYFYAAIAKMNVDWINGMPLHDWIGGKAASGGLESFLSWPMAIYFFTYGGLLYDLIIAPLLLYKKTRAFAFCLTLSFHLTNYYLFNIGIFPWFMIGATTIFFSSDWARNFLHFLFPKRIAPISLIKTIPTHLNKWQKVWLFAIIVHLSFQALFPLRHFLYPGYVGWDEAGHNFSWHMKLRSKQGTTEFTVKDPDTGKTVIIDNKRYLTQRQEAKMAGRPYLILQFAHFLRDLYTNPGEKPAEIYVETKVKLNGRKPQRLIDPTINLASIKPTEIPDSFVFPLRQPVWNAQQKKNRFGPALKKDAIAYKAIPNLEKKGQEVVKSP
jgi:vitamin K-dependent gamma-carboxylase